MRAGWALVLFGWMGLAAAEEPLANPKQAWIAIATDASGGNYKERFERRDKQQRAYLERWEQSGRKAAAEELYYLGLFYESQQRRAEAVRLWLVCAKTKAVAQDVVETARTHLLGAALVLDGHGKAEPGLLAQAVAAGQAALEGFGGDAAERGRLLLDLGRAQDRLGRLDAALASWLAAARAENTLATTAGNYGVNTLLRRAIRSDLYQPTRKRVAAFVDQIANVIKARQPDRTLARMRRGASLLGERAPEWTALHAFGGTKTVADYKGRVVVIHIGATWNIGTVRGLPVLRDLRAMFKAEDFALVGLWTGGLTVYASRFELDEDFKRKATGTTPPVIRIRPGMRRSPHPPGAGFDAVSTQDAETHASFFKNHQLGWDHFRISILEALDRFGMLALPHLLVLDRKGRVRYIRGGDLLRARKSEMKQLQAVIRGLLAEER